MLSLHELMDEISANVEWRSYSGDAITEKTAQQIRRLNASGYGFVVNSDWRFGQRHPEAVRVSQVNNRYHGYPKRIIWALPPKGERGKQR